MRQIAGKDQGDPTASGYIKNVLTGTEINVNVAPRQIEVRAAIQGRVVKIEPSALGKGKKNIGTPPDTGNLKTEFGVIEAVLKVGQDELSRAFIAELGRVNIIGVIDAAPGSTNTGAGRLATNDRVGMDDRDVLFSGIVPSGTLSLEFENRPSGDVVVWDVKYT